MTIFELGALGEFVGAMLLFASIVFVGFQIKQNTNATKAQIRQARTDVKQQHLLATGLDEKHQNILIKCGFPNPSIESLANLSEIETRQVQTIVGVQMLSLSNDIYQNELGFVDDSTLDRQIRRMEKNGMLDAMMLIAKEDPMAQNLIDVVQARYPEIGANTKVG